MRSKVLNVVGVLGTLAFGVQMLSAQSSQTIHGFVSDSRCGTAHSSPSAAASKCIKGCLKGSSEAVVVSDGKVYHLKGKTGQVGKYAGENVTVTGTVDGDTLTVDSVSPEKS
ncbi:MAG TPA: DUF5818 domain-containing protein [Acidobacteriaceae bacterium]|jgi:hypothetical protein